jgi:hypothetical protein
VELLNQAVSEAVYRVSMKEVSIRFSLALVYSLYVGILGVIPALVSIVSTYLFVDNLNEVIGQYRDFFTGSELSTTNHLTTVEMLAWHVLPLAAYYGEKVVREQFPQMIAVLKQFTMLFGKYFIHSDLNIVDTACQMVENDLKKMIKLKNWKAVSFKQN